MGIIDIALVLAVTGLGFVSGFCIRGLLGFSDSRGDWSIPISVQDQYEPPRRGPADTRETPFGP